MLNNIYINFKSKLACYDLSSAILSKFQKNIPIIICLGSNNVLSDMVGVFVGDFLRAKHLPIVIFGGSKHNVDKNTAKMLYKKIDKDKLLFIDSGLLSQKNSIMFSNQTILNDGTKLDSPSICCSTVQMENGEIKLAEVSYKKVLKYANVVANSICDYYSYVSLLKNISQ